MEKKQTVIEALKKVKAKKLTKKEIEEIRINAYTYTY